MKPETYLRGEPALENRRALNITVKQIILAFAVLVLIIAVSLGAVHWYSTGRYIETTDDAYIGGNVTEISPHISGFIASVEVTDNQAVKAGDVLVRIAAPDFKAAMARAGAVVQQRLAAVQNLKARIALQRSRIVRSQADLAARQDGADFAALDARRYAHLAEIQVGSARDAEKSRTAYRTAQSSVLAAIAEVEAGRRQLGVLKSAMAEADAALAQARAEQRTAQLNLGYTEIRSPINGFIGNRSARVGAYVTAGNHLLSIVPVKGLWVDANFKEDQIRNMRPGKPATVVLDLLPDHPLHGRVVSLSPATSAVFSVIPPQNATGNFTKIVQRLTVRIVIDENTMTRHLLRPGLSTTVSVNTRPNSGDAS